MRRQMIHKYPEISRRQLLRLSRTILCASNKNCKPIQSDYCTSCNPRGVALQYILYSDLRPGSVTPKSVPPKIGPAIPILAEKFAKIGPPRSLLLPKVVRPDQFWQPKVVPLCQFALAL